MAEEKQFTQLFGNLLFTKIFKTFRMAIQPSKLVIGFLAIAALCLLGLLMDLNKTVVTAGVTSAEIGSMPMAGRFVSGFPTELHCFVAAPEQVKTFRDRYDKPADRAGVFNTLSRFCAARFNDGVAELFRLNFTEVFIQFSMCVQALLWVFCYHTIYSIIFFSAFVVVVALAGGAICRMAALQFANDERPGIVEGLQFGRQKLVHFICAPLIPLALILIFGFFIFALGLIGNIPYAGELLVAVLLIFALILAFLITLVIAGTAGGLNLMYPAIAYESSDSFEAINRSFSHIYAQPWRMGFYTLIAVVYGAACYVFVRLFTFVLLVVTYGFLRLGLWQHSSQVSSVNKLEAIWPMPDYLNLFGSSFIQLNWSESASSFVVWLIGFIVFSCVAAFVISFFFSANTIIYALMRNRVDNTPIEEIYIDSGNDLNKATAVEDLPTDISPNT